MVPMLSDKLQKMGLARNSLEGKVAIVTGAGRGIGRELARALAWMGARVVIAEIADTGKEVMLQIRSEGGSALFVRTDVSDERSVRLLAEEAVHEFGPVDILVNNAIVSPTGTVLETPVETWDAVYAVNVRGAVIMVRTFLRGMMDRRHGVIVNTASAEGIPFVGAYSASKMALRSMAFSLAAELGDESGISVFVFEPGMVDTPGAQQAFHEMAPRMALTYEQFVGQGFNEGYKGLMPAEDCAAGFAHAIVHAGEYHGQTASPTRPLAEAELLETGTPGKNRLKPGHSVEPPLAPLLTPLVHEFRSIVEGMNAEFDRLPFFGRMFARRDIQARTGLTIREWLKDARELEGEVEGDVGLERSAGLLLVPRLQKLAAYLAGSEKTIRDWTKDPDLHKSALEDLAHRKEVVGSLMESLTPPAKEL